MHRFPNPGSTLDNIVNIFVFIYENIDRNNIFNLHDMQEILVLNGLISSSGNIGIEALLGGSNKDLSRDKTYNQCKMYAEIYRSLGWIQSGEKALLYNFTLLGDHVVRATNRTPIISKCFLGMAFPNEVLAVKGDYELRPFVAILKTMKRLNGVLSRDEMILGPLSLSDDTNDQKFDEMCQNLINLRLDSDDFNEALDKMTKARKISKTTAGNYTRLPLGVLRDLDWALPVEDNVNYSKIQNTYKMTQNGKSVLASVINNHRDIRMKNLKSLSEDKIVKLSKYSFYKTLEYCNFDISNLDFDFSELTNEINSEFGTDNILFSPFQQLSRDTLFDIFQDSMPVTKRASTYVPTENVSQNTVSRLQESIIPVENEPHTESNAFSKEVQLLLHDHTEEEVASKIKETYKGYTKEKFYPLIGNIFNSMGIQCDIPPHGVNSRRWDAILLSEEEDSIPIEIKSPTEELHISVKAVRQALENKIILQSRQAVPNKQETSTYAVGFELPNARAEVSELINDIEKIYGIKIAIMGIDELLRLSVNCIAANKTIAFDNLAKTKGIING